MNTDNDTNGDVDTTIEELLKDDPNETKQAEKQEKPKQDSNDAITGDSMKMMEDLCTKNIAVTTFSTTAEMIVDKYTDDDDTKLADRKKKRDRLVIYCTDCKSNLSLMKYFHHSVICLIYRTMYVDSCLVCLSLRFFVASHPRDFQANIRLFYS